MRTSDHQCCSTGCGETTWAWLTNIPDREYWILCASLKTVCFIHGGCSAHNVSLVSTLGLGVTHILHILLCFLSVSSSPHPKYNSNHLCASRLHLLLNILNTGAFTATDIIFSLILKTQSSWTLVAVYGFFVGLLWGLHLLVYTGLS